MAEEAEDGVMGRMRRMYFCFQAQRKKQRHTPLPTLTTEASTTPKSRPPQKRIHWEHVVVVGREARVGGECGSDGEYDGGGGGE
jgi:hypothetical protein